MKNSPNFTFQSDKIITSKFIENKVTDFTGACQFIKHLPYGRNDNKYDLTTLFSDKCGTCSTKHALLKTLAIENQVTEIKLYIGLFKMHAQNTPSIEKTLQKCGLEYMPEAHCYVRYNEQIIDLTSSDSSESDFINDLIEEQEIFPNQITDYKVAYHKKYITSWLSYHPEIPYSLEEIWQIREQCIHDLSFVQK